MKVLRCIWRNEVGVEWPADSAAGTTELQDTVLHALLENGELCAGSGQIRDFLGIGQRVVDLKIIVVGLHVAADAFEAIQVNDLLQITRGTATGPFKLAVLRSAAWEIVFHIDGAGSLRTCDGERGDERYAIRARGGGQAGEFGEGGHPVVELRRRVADAAGPYSARPPNKRRFPQAAFPTVALDAVHGTERAEKGGVLGVNPAAAGFIVWAVVGGENHEGVVFDFQVTQELQQIAGDIIQPPDHGGVTFLGFGPGHFRGGGIVIVIPGGVDVIGMDPGIDLAGGGIDHGTRGAGPLHAAMQAAAGGIRPGGYLQLRMRGIVGEVDEKWMGGVGGQLVHDPSLGAGRPQVCRVTLVELGDDIRVVAVPDGLAAFLGVMVMAVQMGHVAEEIVEAAMFRVRFGDGPGALQTPFAKGGGGIAGGFQHAGEGVIVFQCLVELVVADIGVSLMDAEQQGGAEGAQTGAEL